LANRKVSLTIRITEGDKRLLVKPVSAANGRIRPLYALVNGVLFGCVVAYLLMDVLLTGFAKVPFTFVCSRLRLR
jgi:hypothetical protein